MSDKISRSLTDLFETTRVVFWYDVGAKMRAEFDSCAIPSVTKIELDHNEFQVKHRILKLENESKFLIYSEKPEPLNKNNWLLDLSLRFKEFKADPISLALSELGLNDEYNTVIQEHSLFFSDKRRKESLKEFIGTTEQSAKTLRRSMISVVCGSRSLQLPYVLLPLIREDYLTESGESTDERYSALRRFNLLTYLWQWIEEIFGYSAKQATIRDFVITLFRDSFSGDQTSDGYQLTNDARIFLRETWKDSRQNVDTFQFFSDLVAKRFSIEDSLADRSLKSIVDLDDFQEIDLKILSTLIERLNDQTIDPEEVKDITRKRMNTHWCRVDPVLRHSYKAIENAAEFIQKFNTSTFTVESLESGFRNYINHWFLIDRLYRKFIFHANNSKQTTIFQRLRELIENKYEHGYLSNLSQSWHPLVAKQSIWSIDTFTRQDDFYVNFIDPLIKNENKAFVVISDALRYEIGEEFNKSLIAEGFETDITPMYSMLPSYTQLGMAALLPHENLSFLGDGGNLIKADGLRTDGSVNRQAVLQRRVQTSKVILAGELLASTTDEIKRLVKDHQLIYIYHNKIDAIGDKRDTESQTFDAAEKALEDLRSVVKKLTSSNANKIFITSDHGFLYSERQLENADFYDEEVTGKKIHHLNRRFVLGEKFTTPIGFQNFSEKDLGLNGDLEVVIPKSLSRMRLKGSGSRFVHGGASLQEIAIPVIHVKTKLKQVLERVEIEILQAHNRVISTGQVSVKLYQTRPITEKVLSRKVRAGIFSLSGTLISDSKEILFNFESLSERDREFPVNFILSQAANQMNGQEVELRLLDMTDERTSQHPIHRSVRYTIKRSFKSDFEF